MGSSHHAETSERRSRTHGAKDRENKAYELRAYFAANYVDPITSIKVTEGAVTPVARARNSPLSRLVAICDKAIADLPCRGLEKFCSVAGINGYRTSSKVEMCNIILRHRESVESALNNGGTVPVAAGTITGAKPTTSTQVGTIVGEPSSVNDTTAAPLTVEAGGAAGSDSHADSASAAATVPPGLLSPRTCWVQLYIGEGKRGHPFKVKLPGREPDFDDLVQAVFEKCQLLLREHCIPSELMVMRLGSVLDPGDPIRILTSSKRPFIVKAPNPV